MTAAAGPVVVVGTGAAGMATVNGLRRNGLDGLITWIGAERHLPLRPAAAVQADPDRPNGDWSGFASEQQAGTGVLRWAGG
jgi:cation diffusion facilitator CzcD-associated flavoprotein CzcO